MDRDEEEEEEEALPEYLRQEKEDDPMELQKEVVGLMKEQIAIQKESNKERHSPFPGYKLPSKEEMDAHHELSEIASEQHSVMAFANAILRCQSVVSSRDSGYGERKPEIDPDAAVDMAFDIVQKIKKKFEARRVKAEAALEKFDSTMPRPISRPINGG